MRRTSNAWNGLKGLILEKKLTHWKNKEKDWGVRKEKGYKGINMHINKYVMNDNE